MAAGFELTSPLLVWGSAACSDSNVVANRAGTLAPFTSRAPVGRPGVFPHGRKGACIACLEMDFRMGRAVAYRLRFRGGGGSEATQELHLPMDIGDRLLYSIDA